MPVGSFNVASENDPATKVCSFIGLNQAINGSRRILASNCRRPPQTTGVV
jgi:hypothetical protein